MTSSCSAQPLRHSPDPDATAGSSPQALCCDGTDDASPVTGPRQVDHEGDHPPLPNSADSPWSQFLHSQAAVACDFFTIDTASLRRYYVLFFIDVTTREVYIAGITANPTVAWKTQAARNLFLRHADQLAGSRALVRDRGSQFIDAFDEIFRTEGLTILETPVRTPVANTFAERWIGTIRRELLDRTIIWNQHQLEQLVVDYTDHYNQHRPHRSLGQRPPLVSEAPTPLNQRQLHIVKSTRCHGLINEYQDAA